MILITGATGTNGREVVKQLSDKGVQIRVMVRNLTASSQIRTYHRYLTPAPAADSGTEGTERNNGIRPSTRVG